MVCLDAGIRISPRFQYGTQILVHVGDMGHIHMISHPSNRKTKLLHNYHRKQWVLVKESRTSGDTLSQEVKAIFSARRKGYTFAF